MAAGNVQTDHIAARGLCRGGIAGDARPAGCGSGIASMCLGFGLSVRSWLRAALSGAVVVALCASAVAEVKVTVSKRDHVVQGTTAAGLVRSLNSNPIR